MICIADKIKKALRSIIEAFESGNIPEAIAYSTFPVSNIPSSKWSLLNRTLMFLSGTADARGFRQWKHVNRYVKKGAKALYILVPRILKRENTDGEEENVISGFMARPVFRMEDTEGEKLDYEKEELPEFPLIRKAKEWGISVKAIPGNYHYYGYFSEGRKEIGLATKEESVFFHELAHAACYRLKIYCQGRQTWKEEVVAELTAAVLCRLIGKTSKYLGSNYRYINYYAERANLNPVQACLRVMSKVEQVLKLILAPGQG